MDALACLVLSVPEVQNARCAPSRAVWSSGMSPIAKS